MNTSVNTSEVSLPPAQAVGWGVKIGGDEANVTETLRFGTAKWLAKPSYGRKIAKVTDETQFDGMNNKSNGKSRMRTFLVFLSVIGAISIPIRSAGQNLVNNGNLGTGDLSDWTTFVTANGTIGGGFGLPNVVSFDVAGTGNPSDAAQFQVGQVSFVVGQEAGGGIEQTFNCSAGEYLISADVAAADTTSVYDFSDPGLFTLLIDGTTIATGSWAGIDIYPGQIMRDVLDATVPLSQGSHELSIEITRPWVNTGVFWEPPLGSTPLEYVDNINVEAVTEPSVISLGLLGLVVLLSVKKSRQVITSY